MTGRVVLITAMLAILAGCAQVEQSALNPFNWFGQDEQVTNPAVVAAGPSDPRPLVSQVTSVSIERMPGGAILRAVGLPATQGYWAADLIQVPNAPPGVLAYRFRAAPPLEPTRTSTQASREIVAATFISDQRLAGTREIQVLGAQSSRSVRR